MDFKQKQRLIGQKTDWWDMNNYVDSGFTLQNVRQKMFEIDGDLISREEQSRRTVQELQQYQDPQAAELEELKRKRIEKQNEELEKEYRERYDGFTGTLKYFWDGLVQAPRGYQILKEAKVIDYVEEKAQDGVDEVIDKIVDNPVTNTISGVYNFLKSLIQNRYLYLLGFIFIIILIKKV